MEPATKQSTPHELYSTLPVRQDLTDAHLEVWESLAEPGTWLTGAQHVAIMSETRMALNCQYCRDRKDVISPYALQGQHVTATDLDPDWIDAIHRIVTDPARLSEKLFRDLAARGVTDAEYVEMLGVALFTLAIDTFHHALGMPLLPLPSPQEGQLSRQRPQHLEDIGAWVPVLSTKSPVAKSLYAGALRVSNVARAFSLVPAITKLQIRLIEAQYVPIAQIIAPAESPRVISRTQIELIASRVSTINECFY